MDEGFLTDVALVRPFPRVASNVFNYSRPSCEGLTAVLARVRALSIMSPPVFLKVAFPFESLLAQDTTVASLSAVAPAVSQIRGLLNKANVAV